MATYPIDQGGLQAIVNVTADPGRVQLTEMEGGANRGWVDQDQDYFFLEIRHPWLLIATDIATIEAFWTANVGLNDVLFETENKGDFQGLLLARPTIVEESGPYGVVVTRARCVKL